MSQGLFCFLQEMRTGVLASQADFLSCSNSADVGTANCARWKICFGRHPILSLIELVSIKAADFGGCCGRY